MRKKDIYTLLDRWTNAGTITTEQAEYMRDDVATFISEKSGKKFIAAIMYIGATALSLGALLLIASNWPSLSKGVKLMLIFLLPVIPLVFAYYHIVLRENVRTLGRSASVLGLTLIGGSIALIGQLYHTEPDMVVFLWLWLLLAVPAIFIFKTIETVFFNVILLGAALFALLVQFFDTTGIDERAGVVIMTLVAGLYAYALYASGAFLRNVTAWLATGRMLRLFGAALAVTILFLTTFEYYARMLVGATYRDPKNWEIVSIALNIAFIAFLVFALMRALKHEEHAFAFSIVRLFGVYLLVKYITLFNSILDTGLFFMLGGVLFIAGGWFLENRKDTLISYMKNTHRSDGLLS